MPRGVEWNERLYERSPICCVLTLIFWFLLQALEPHIAEEIMTLHHTKHHQTYVNGLNAAEEAYAATDSTAKHISLQNALKFNGGGQLLTPPRTNVAGIK